MEKRAEIVVKGRVQKAGYRDYIDEVAFDLNLSGWVKNLEDGTVKIVCEGRNKNVEEFINKLKIREYPIRVDDAIVEYFPATGEFKEFTIIREEEIVFATYERLDAAARYMREMNNNLGGKFDKMLDKQDKMLGQQDKMLGQQDKMLDKQDKILDKQDSLQDTVKNGFKDVKDEIHLLRDDFREVFRSEVNELRGEIGELRQSIARIEMGMAK